MTIPLNMQKRLALVLWGAAFLALVAAGAGVLIYQNLTLDQRARQNMEPYAQLVSVGTDTAVAFEDPERALEILGTLKANSQIREADLFLADGRLLASFSHTAGAPPRNMPLRPDGIHLAGELAELLQTLPSGARLRIGMDRAQLGEQARQALWAFIAGALVLLAFTLAQLTVLRRTIAHPIALLTEAAERVRAEADYRHRVSASGSDEVVRLGRSFNDMLETIQRREDDLRRLSIFQRTILDNAAHGVISSTPDGIVTSFNPAAERMLGYAADEIVGQQSLLLWQEPHEIARRAIELSEELGEPVVPGLDVFTARLRRGLTEEREWTFIRKNGVRVPVNLSITVVRDESGAIAGYVCMAHDLTERMQVEAELERHRHHLEEEVVIRTHQLAEARDAANAANRAKSAFLARMSHELRTPLNAILGYAQILLRKPELDERLHRGLEVIRQSGEQLLTLINDILDLAKIEAGKVALNPSTVDLRAFLRVIADIVSVRARDKGLVFVCDAEADLPAAVCVDERILRQALLNLLSNAVKFTDRGSVTLRARPTSDGGICFAVEDTGVGILPAYLGKIFQPFEQVGDVRRQSGGTGLGLAIGREFVHLLGGEIDVESSPGEGSQFRFELKLPVVAAREEVPVATEVVSGYAGPRRKILIVDDVAENRAVLEAALEPLGFELVQAVDGEEAVDKTLELCPDLILMDAVMPGIDGLEATCCLRKMPAFAELPIIIVSASATTGDHEKALRAGAQAFLAKPIDLDLLLNQIGILLRLDLIREASCGLFRAIDYEASFVVPPAGDMAMLHEFALQGDMRGIAAKAEELKVTPAYGPFADRLRELAAGFQSQAIQRLIERLME